MTITFERALKWAAMTSSGVAVLGGILIGCPDLSTNSAEVACLVVGVASIVWMVVRAIREGGYRLDAGVLAGLTKSDRRLVGNTRRRPGQVPGHLTPVAERHARQQADNNDRTGWLTVAFVLLNGPTSSDGGGTFPAVVDVVLVGVIIVLGFWSDWLGGRWRRAQATMGERVHARYRAQQPAHDATGRARPDESDAGRPAGVDG